MSNIVEEGKSIEGNAIDGNSRKPIKNRGMVKYKDKTCHQFKAEFDVTAAISQTLSKGDNIIDKNAITSKNFSIKCSTAMVHSIKKKYSQEVKEGVSATHGASVWSFPHLTNVKIIKPHTEIVNAIFNRSKDKIEL